MGRTLVVLFLFINLMLCFYIAYELFRTADYLASAFRLLALTGLTPPDFNEIKALGVYVFLLGLSGFAMAYWIYEDGKTINKLIRSRRIFTRAKTQEKPITPVTTEYTQIQLLECPECGEELEEDFEVCPKCGYELKPITCPKCGKEISRKFDFCPYCGNTIKKEE